MIVGTGATHNFVSQKLVNENSSKVSNTAPVKLELSNGQIGNKNRFKNR